MSEAKTSLFLCIGILVSKTDNVINFAHLVKKVSVDYVFMIKILIIAGKTGKGSFMAK